MLSHPHQLANSHVKQLGEQTSVLNSSNLKFTTHSKASSKKELSPHQLNSQFRQQIRNKYIQNYKRSVRFGLSVQDAIEYINQRNSKVVESQEMIDQAIRNLNMQYLVELIAQANLQFAVVLICRHRELIELVESRLELPSSLILLSKLCQLNSQFIVQAMRHKLFIRFVQLLAKFGSTAQYPELLSNALATMTKEPLLLKRPQLMDSLPSLFNALTVAFETKNINYRHCNNLLRLVSNISYQIEYPTYFLSPLLQIKPKESADALSLIITIEQQVEKMEASQNNDMNIKIIQSLLHLYFQINQKQLRSIKVRSLHSLVGSIVEKSEDPVAIHVADNRFKEILSQYSYGRLEYYQLISTLLRKLSKMNYPILIQNLQKQGILSNLVTDISDPSCDIGFASLVCIGQVVSEAKHTGNNLLIDSLLQINLRHEVQAFLQDKRNSHMIEQAEKLLAMISSTH